VQLRVARHTERLDEVVAFYRDGIGLTEIGGFSDHDGYDGVFLAVPGTDGHLEFTAGGGHGAPAPHPESLLVLYLGDREAVQAVAARLGVDPVPPANPYWAEHGVTFEDPDGFRVVLVPERGEGSERQLRRAVARVVWRVMNPAARRLAGLAPWWVVLETTGSKSGRPRQVPLARGPVEGSTTWVISVHGRHAGFAHNIVSSPHVRLKLRGRWYSGTASIEPLDPAVVSRFNRYGQLGPATLGWDPALVRIELHEPPGR
jgi:deazaflavin-dependent oxidoreductase (nitroreductase family)